jgi:acyl-CoA dehydrogenase
MNFEYSEKTRDSIDRVRGFIKDEVAPAESTYYDQLTQRLWETPPVMDELKAKAKEQGLWNLFMPKAYARFSPGLSNLEYAPLAEEMGRYLIAPEVFNCNAPDTGNMEVLAKYGSAKQQAQWLKPLMEGTIRSAFAMTEPAVASSDATNIETSIRRDGDTYVINGRKFFISGAMRKTCEILIVMGKTDPDHPDRHKQQSQILVPVATPGVTVVRPMQVLGTVGAPEGHAEIVFENVRVPAENIILGAGRGFEIAQGRLGPGRIHHCMRLIGGAQRCLEMMCRRANERVVFGRPMNKQGSVREDIANSHCEIEQARLLTLKAADVMDRHGNREAKELISMIKIVAPSMAQRVADRAMQLHGAVGLSQDTPLAAFFTYARTIRLADGPDQVHMMQLGRNLARKYA